MPRVLSASILACLACALAAAIAAPQAHQAPAPAPFRGGVDLVPLTVTVTDRQRRFIRDLSPEDFTILEDGRPQNVSFFTRANLPLRIVLVLDSSLSMEGALSTVHEAATEFVRGLRPQDSGEVVDFDTRVRILEPFTSDRDALERAIRLTKADGTTALHDAVFLSLQELNALPAGAPNDWPDRHAIVLLSDGDDTSSLTSFDAVLDLANRSDTAIYAIGLGERDAAGHLAKYDAEFALRRLANESGGRAFFPNDIREISAVYDAITQELASQYAIAYASTNSRRDGRWRNISVRMADRGLDARTRPGYYAPRYR